MGDSLDVELFKYTGFNMDKNPPAGVKSRVINNEGIVLDVLKLYEFESALQRMSVIVKEKEDYYVFVKGSPEKMA
jgi:cation-transporting ATPase 13A3/4/5